MATVQCMHIRCSQPATVLLRPKYGRDWPACPEHLEAMEKALYIGQAVDSGSVRRMPVHSVRAAAIRAAS